MSTCLAACTGDKTKQVCGVWSVWPPCKFFLSEKGVSALFLEGAVVCFHQYLGAQWERRQQGGAVCTAYLLMLPGNTSENDCCLGSCVMWSGRN
jgi:hypothetical protein